MCQPRCPAYITSSLQRAFDQGSQVDYLHRYTKVSLSIGKHSTQTTWLSAVVFIRKRSRNEGTFQTIILQGSCYWEEDSGIPQSFGSKGKIDETLASVVADLFSALIPNSHRGLVVISLCLLTVWESILPSTSFVSSEEVKMRGASLIRWQFLMIILLANCRFFWLFFWEQTAAILVGYGGCINQVLGMLKDWQSKNKNKRILHDIVWNRFPGRQNILEIWL